MNLRSRIPTARHRSRGPGRSRFIAAPAADAPAADTSDWKCTQCPFLQGYEADAEVGVLTASGANATFGRYTGIDHGGAYADA